jgi:hypothetical protein
MPDDHAQNTGQQLRHTLPRTRSLLEIGAVSSCYQAETEVCSETGHSILMSACFTALTAGNGALSIGQHYVKGFPDPVELFSPAREPDRVG